MQILKRARNSELELIPDTESDSNVRDEVNRRSAKAGYTDRDGQPRMSRSSSAGMGDVPRPVNKKLYDRNYERIFGHK